MKFISIGTNRVTFTSKLRDDCLPFDYNSNNLVDGGGGERQTIGHRKCSQKPKGLGFQSIIISVPRKLLKVLLRDLPIMLKVLTLNK